MLHVLAEAAKPLPYLKPVKASLYVVIAASPASATGSV